MLYFIKSQNYLKIGYSQSFETLIKRMQSYCTHNPNFILISFTEFGSKEDEVELHQLCKEFLYNNEWFLDNVKIYEIWEEQVKIKNLIPKNCFYEFPKDQKDFQSLNYRQVWDSVIPFTLENDKDPIYNELNEINLQKYFGRKQKTFTQEDFIRACGFASKELNIEVNRNLLKKFGYDIAGNTGMITIFKINDIFFD